MLAISKFIIIILFFTSIGWSQSQSTFKRTTATILFASIGGGVLGLSTLSFYGKPQEHTDNITTGVLIGFLAGLSYVMYDNYDFRSNTGAPLTTTQKQLVAINSEDSIRDLKQQRPTSSWPLVSVDYSF